jgi:hypothetical protein
LLYRVLALRLPLAAFLRLQDVSAFRFDRPGASCNRTERSQAGDTVSSPDPSNAHKVPAYSAA